MQNPTATPPTRNKQILRVVGLGSLAVVLVGTGLLYWHLHSIFKNTHPELPVVSYAAFVWQPETSQKITPDALRDEVLTLSGVTACALNPESRLVSFAFEPSRVQKTDVRRFLEKQGITIVEEKVFEAPANSKCMYANVPNWLIRLVQ